MGSPSAAVGGVFADKHFGARRVHWNSIETKRTIELDFSRQAGVDSLWAEKFQCLCGLVEQAVPEMERKLRVKTAQNCNYVIFVGLDGSFSSVGAMQVGGHELIVDALFVHELFETFRAFIIKHLEKGAEAVIGKFCVEESGGAQELVGTTRLDGFCQYGIAVVV